MISKAVEYRLVKAMVEELTMMPGLPESLEENFIEHIREMRQGRMEWGKFGGGVTDKEMLRALEKARECLGAGFDMEEKPS